MNPQTLADLSASPPRPDSAPDPNADQVPAPTPAPATPAGLATLAEQAAGYADRARGPGTNIAYRSAWNAYAAWCADIGQPPLSGDPALLALYLTRRAEAGLAVSSLQVARAAIRAGHRVAGVPLDLADPRLALVMQGIARTHGVRARRQAAPAVSDVLRRLLAAPPAPNTPQAAAPALLARRRAMLLIGFGAALRRSEIVALAIGDVAVVEHRGLSVLVRRSKTDQRGAGRSLAIWANRAEPEFCPLSAFETWMTVRRTAPDLKQPHVTRPDGGPASAEAPPLLRDRDARPLFCGVTSAGAPTGETMSDKVVARTLKQACALAGLDPEKFSGHSLRRGLLTEAGDRQLPLVDLMRQSRHRSVATALTYIDASDIWRNNITEAVFAGPRR